MEEMSMLAEISPLLEQPDFDCSQTAGFSGQIRSRCGMACPYDDKSSRLGAFPPPASHRNGYSKGQ